MTQSAYTEDTIVIRDRRPEHYAFVLACVSSEAFVAHASATANGAEGELVCAGEVRSIRSN